MKKNIVFASMLSVAFAFPVFAQTGEVEVPSLSEVFQTLSSDQISASETAVENGNDLTFDQDLAVDQAVSEAVAQGIVSSEDAGDVAATLELVNSNVEYFDFDILESIGEVLESGFTVEEVRGTLEAFNNLSNEGKAIVGKQDFSFSDSDISTLSEADQAIVEDQFPDFSATGAPTTSE